MAGLNRLRTAEPAECERLSQPGTSRSTSIAAAYDISCSCGCYMVEPVEKRSFISRRQNFGASFACGAIVPAKWVGFRRACEIPGFVTLVCRDHDHGT